MKKPFKIQRIYVEKILIKDFQMLEKGKIIESFEIITFTLNNDINLEDNAIEAIIKKCKFFEKVVLQTF